MHSSRFIGSGVSADLWANVAGVTAGVGGGGLGFGAILLLTGPRTGPERAELSRVEEELAAIREEGG